MMKRIKLTMSKLFTPKQDDYSELKTQLKKLQEELQFAIDRNLLNSSRLSDFRCKYAIILEAKRNTPSQTQKRLQERFDNFLKQYKEYQFGEPIKRPKPDSVLSRDNLKNSEMHTNYNSRHTSSRINANQTTCQTSFQGKWQKPNSEQVLSSSDTNRTANSTSGTQKEVHQSNDVEMKDVPDRNQEDIAKEYKNGTPFSGRSTLQSEECDRSFSQGVLENERLNLRRRSNEGKTENFQQNENSRNKETSYEIPRKVGQTQTTPSRIRQPTSRTNLALEDEFQNLNTKTEVCSDMKHKTCLSRSPVQRKQEQNESFTNVNKESGYNEGKTRSCLHGNSRYKETHFDTLESQGESRKNSGSAGSRIARSVAQNCEIESPSKRPPGGRNQGLDLSSRERDIYEESRHCYEEEIGDVRIQIEEKEILLQEHEKIKKFIDENKKSQRSTEEVNRRHIHGYQSSQPEPVLVIEKDGFKTIIQQFQVKEKENQVAERRLDRHQLGYGPSIEQRQEESGSKSYQGQNVRRFSNENKDTSSKILQDYHTKTPQEIRGRGKVMLNKTYPNYGLTQNYHQDESRNRQQQYRRSPGIATASYRGSPPTSFREDHRTEVAVEAVEPLQILDVHKLFQDDFDLKSLDGSTDAITQIETVKKWAGTFEEKVSNFSEAKFSLEYFVLDEKLMRFIEHLDKLKCREDKIATQKKIEVIEYIKGLHKTLDSRATDE